MGGQPATCDHGGVLAFRRSPTDRVLSGVAGGLGERLGVDPMLVRVAFVVLCGAGGFGALAYVVAWVLSGEPTAEPSRPAPGSPSSRQLLALGCMLLGLLLLLRELGLWLGDAVAWPLALAGAGSAAMWVRSDERERARAAGLASRVPVQSPGGRGSKLRVVVGAVLVVTGMGAVLAGQQALTFQAVGPVLLAIVVTTAGIGLVLGPWVARLARQITDERRERIRSEERAEVAAHLHDSVLQTLALIQRSRDPVEMAALARGQERDLRAWLFGAGGDPDRLRAALEGTAARIERRHRVPIDVVVVGDAALDDRLRALVQAAAEAMTNAARHSDAERVSVYAEVESGQVTLFVSDQGAGFEPEAVPPGRLGIAESIRGRMARHGGEAEVVSEPGEGTEVRLRLPLEVAV